MGAATGNVNRIFAVVQDWKAVAGKARKGVASCRVAANEVSEDLWGREDDSDGDGEYG